MIERRNEIEALEAAVLLVAYDKPSLLSAKMLHDVDLPFPLVVDHSKEVYARWGMGRTGLTGAMLSPTLNLRYFKLIVSGERFLGFAPDMFQLGGDFIVDNEGNLAFAHRMTNNGDRAAVGALIGALTRLHDSSGGRERRSTKSDVEHQF